MTVSIEVIKAQDEPRLNELEWFTTSSYEKLNDLSIRELFNELAYRVKLYNRIKTGEDGAFFPTDEWLSILNGNPIVTKILSSDSYNSYLPPPENKCKCTFTGTGITLAMPSQISELHDYYNTQHRVISISNNHIVLLLKKACYGCSFCSSYLDGILSKRAQGGDNKPVSIEKFCVDCCKMIELIDTEYNIVEHVPSSQIIVACEHCDTPRLNLNFDRNLINHLLAIDFFNFTNQQLKDSFDYQVDNFRQILQIPEPSTSIKVHPKNYFSTLIVDKVIPFLDLMLWEIWCFDHTENSIEFNTHLDEHFESIPKLKSQIISIHLFKIHDKRDDEWVNKKRKSTIAKYLDLVAFQQKLNAIKSDHEYLSRPATY